MTKNAFKKYRIKIISLNLLFYITMAGLLLFALYNKNINDILFSENFLPKNLQLFFNSFLQRDSSSSNFLFVYVWAFLVIPLIDINRNYFREKRKYYISANIIEKNNKKFQKIAFYFFLSITFINLIFFIFVAEETFMNKYGLTFSENTFLYSFLALIPNITLVLTTKLL